VAKRYLLPALFCTMLSCTFIAPLPSIRAEITIDDFTQTATVTELSSGSTLKSAVTDHVGSLDANRELLIYVRLTEPAWSFDSAVTSPGSAFASLAGHTRTGQNSPAIEFDFRYEFSPTDLTENGNNNAFLFDFASHQGTEHPLFLRITALGATASESYAAFKFDVPFSDRPFTSAIPFTDFTLRGGGPASPNFSTLHRIQFDFFFQSPSEQIDWSVRLDRIRIGTVAIPEPDVVSIALIGMFPILRRYQTQRTGP